MIALETALAAYAVAKAFGAALLLGMAYGPHGEGGSVSNTCRICGCRKPEDGRCRHCSWLPEDSAPAEPIDEPADEPADDPEVDGDVDDG